GAATAPMTIAASGVTKPAAGVIATKPTTAPVTIPRMLGLLSRQLKNIQTTAAAAAAVLVVTTALTASPFAASALPPLKPNQPIHNKPAPRTVNGILLGSIVACPNHLRLPSTIAKAKAENPAVICTTVPPAKSSAPMLRKMPPTPHTQCATGSYTNVAHNSVKIRNDLKRIRSTNAPVMSAGVMMANII